MSEDEFGSYIEGQGYVPGKRKKRIPETPAAPERSQMKPSEGFRDNQEMMGAGIQRVLTKVFNTVPRNRLKEAGLD